MCAARITFKDRITPMLDIALHQMATFINQSLHQSLMVNEEMVVLSAIVESDGTPSPTCANKIVLFLAGIERDVTLRAQPPTELNDGKNERHNVVTVLVMCAANFGSSNYPEALKLLSLTMQSLESTPVIDRSVAPALEPTLERLTISPEKLTRRK